MFSFDTREIQKLARDLERFRVAIPDLVTGEVVRQVREFADSGVNPDGSKWPALTAAYAARKRKQVGNSKANKKLTGQLLMSVKNRDMVVAPDSANMPKAQGLEKKRKSFEVAPITPGNVERLLYKAYEAL